jgi:hypothetical protein
LENSPEEKSDSFVIATSEAGSGSAGNASKQLSKYQWQEGAWRTLKN